MTQRCAHQSSAFSFNVQSHAKGGTRPVSVTELQARQGCRAVISELDGQRFFCITKVYIYIKYSSPKIFYLCV